MFVLTAYAAAAAVLLALPVSGLARAGALLILLGTGALSYRRRVSLRCKAAIAGICRNVDGSWQLRERGGALHQASLLADSYLHPELLVLNFRLLSGKRRSVALAGDSAEGASLRRLRVALALREDRSRP